MILFRKLFLLICDLIIGVFTRLRKLGSFVSGDVIFSVSPPLLIKHFYPYDLVMEKSDTPPIELINEIPTIGDLYKIGMVIGYKNVSISGDPKYVKVGYFNTGEISVPEIKYHKPEDLILIYPTLQSARSYTLISQELQNMEEMFDLGTEDPEDGGENGGSGSDSGGNIIH